MPDHSAAPTAPPVPDGLVVEPFRALRYRDVDGAALSRRTSPPYDVIDDAGVDALEQADPVNAVRLILPRDDAGPGSRYAHAARVLVDWRRSGVLALDDEPALYVYEERDGEHVQRGLLGALALVAPDAGIVLPHENTMAGPVSDRLALTEATEANLEPIFLVYDGGGAASAAVAAAGDRPPVAACTTDDGVAHRLWALTDSDTLAAIAADLHSRRAVIADGHHRYATYRRHQADRHAAGAGRGPWDFGLAFLVDATAFGPQVHPIHRVLPTLPFAEALERAAHGFTTRQIEGDEAEALDMLAQAGKAGPAFVLADGAGSWSLLTEPDPDALAAALPAERSAAWRGLDVTVAHGYLVAAVLGLADTEETVAYRHDVAAALAAARDTGGTALLLNATPVEDVIAVAAAGERMPRKSTLFTPKPRTGLVFRPFDA